MKTDPLTSAQKSAIRRAAQRDEQGNAPLISAQRSNEFRKKYGPPNLSMFATPKAVANLGGGLPVDWPTGPGVDFTKDVALKLPTHISATDAAAKDDDDAGSAPETAITSPEESLELSGTKNHEIDAKGAASASTYQVFQKKSVGFGFDYVRAHA